MKMKAILSLTMASIIALSMVGCGNKDNTANSTTAASSTAAASTTAEAEKPKEVKTLSLLMFTDWWNNGGWEDVVNDVNSKADKLGFKLEVEKIAGGDQGNQIVKSRYAAGEMPDLHAYYNANSAVIDCGKDNFIDISGDWTKNYDADLISSKTCTIDGKVIGLPFGSVSVNGMYYNKKVFADLGLQVPTTWTEFLAVCDKIKAAGKVPVYYSGKDSWTLQLMGIDGFERETKNRSIVDIMNDINANKAKYADQKLFIDGLAKMKDLLDKGYVNKTFLSDTYDSAQKAIVEGTAAMYPMATWISGEFTKKYPDKLNDIGAFPIPFDGSDPVSAWGSNTVLVTSGCKEVEAAKAFVNYFGSVEGQQAFFTKLTGIPLMKGVKANATPAETELAKYADERKKVMIWSDLKLYDYGSFDKYCQDLLVGAKTPEQVAQEMDKETAKNAKAKNDPNFK